MLLTPESQGQMTLGHLPDDFVQRLEHRVETGLLVAGQRSRADYRLLSSDRDGITFGTRGFPTT